MYLTINIFIHKAHMSNYHSRHYRLLREGANNMLQNLSKCSIPKRFVIIFMVFLGATNMIYLQTNLAMAVVEMTALKNVTDQFGNVELKAEFNWTPREKGLVLSSYCYGRLLCPIGGFLAGKFGGSTVYSVGCLVISLITFFTPFLLSVDFSLFVATNVVYGVFQAFLFCGPSQLFSRWAPPDERAKFVSFSVVGFFVGSAASFIVAGWVLKEYTWQILFYGSGLVSLAWTCIWFVIVKNDPAQDKRVSESELKYIRDKLNASSVEEKLTYPWRHVFTSSALWIAALAEFSIVSGYVFTSVFLPQYVKDVNNSDIRQIGYISTIPQIFAIISMPLCGCICDYIRSRKILSITNIHRLVASLGLFSAAISYAVVAVWANFVVDIVAISVFQFFSTFTIIDLNVFILDFAPKYAAFMMSIINSIATSSGVLVPTLVASVVTSHSHSQWNVCFLVFTVVYLVAGLFYLKFVSGERASWLNESSVEKTDLSNDDIKL